MSPSPQQSRVATPYHLQVFRQSRYLNLPIAPNNHLLSEDDPRAQSKWLHVVKWGESLHRDSEVRETVGAGHSILQETTLEGRKFDDIFRSTEEKL
ncbi:hypothetical protein BofuT4_uP011250.1 [Botrytis cinerea T4]|uniref:Uncharacterized protein n=1 Tax=Botryotinia fuckeliana (strain T4) TaxID=999810 RepID=G2XTG3_BOTF4|nr:hypothetical protein BofuT4_uP011250.1 [Botrytis cinerea T4]